MTIYGCCTKLQAGKFVVYVYGFHSETLIRIYRCFIAQRSIPLMEKECGEVIGPVVKSVRETLSGNKARRN